jgi:DNA-binding winged helix-turn-helix (wHTH) protein/TolB-like protein/Tfp pilus assembly protein PilF
MSSVAPSAAERAERLPFVFGPYTADPLRRALRRDGDVIHLTRTAFDTLLVLLESHGETVTKEELLARVWEGTAVEENNLNQCISALRKVFGERRGENRYIVTVPGIGYRFVAAVTRPAPEPAPAQPLPIEPGKRHRIRWRVWAIAAAIALAVAAAALFLVRAKARNSRSTLAILGFQNLAGRPDAAWISTALSEMLAIELAQSDRLSVVSGEETGRMRAEMGVPGGPHSPATLEKIARLTGSSLVVSGAYLAPGSDPGSQIRLDLLVEDTRTGGTLAALTESGPERDLAGIAARAGARVRARLGLVSLAPSSSEAAVKAALPASETAARLYAEALEQYRRYDYQEARTLLQDSIAAEPAFALSHVLLSRVWDDLGYIAQARAEAQRGWELAGKLDREHQLAAEAGYRSENQDYRKAADIYAALLRFYPDNLEYSRLMVSSSLKAGRLADAQGVLQQMKRLPRPLSDSPVVDLAEAEFAGWRSDFRTVAAAAHRAVEKGRSLGARSLVARALLSEAGGVTSLGNWQQGERLRDEARAICISIGNRGCEATILRQRGNVQLLGGDAESAESSYEAVLRIGRDTGGRREEINALNGLASAFQMLGRFDESRRTYEQGISVAVELGQGKGAINALNFGLGDVLVWEGDLDRGAKTYSSALSTAQELGDREGTAIGFYSLAQVRWLQGRFAEASDAAGKAEAIYRQLGVAAALEGVQLLQSDSDLLRGVAHLAPARAPATSGAELRFWYARALFDGGRSEAGAAARDAADRFAKARMPHMEAVARALLSRIQARNNDLAAALLELARADELANRSGLPYPKLSVALARAEIENQAAELQRVRHAALKAGYGLIAFEASRLARP